MTTKTKKKQKLRNNEYYNTQEIFDELYFKSKYKENYRFYNLMEHITNKQNIELAYRNIKKNAGSKTRGTNKHTIEHLANKINNDAVEYVNNRLRNYHPHSVLRVEIPKENGKIRPLGIPTIEDRLIQQCIKQVLEPICEAKFHNHSYGFRPNRSTHNAISRCYSLIHIGKLYYVVDIDIKGFFDNVNHAKLLKQMWTMGICDKQLLSIISKMLKAPIEGIGTPTKGTPQGGILSPLLSNIVLNELDWWIANQWEFFKTNRQYAGKGSKLRAMKNTKLKEMYIVRYADDFKIFCRNHNDAIRIFNSIKQWLKERLHLDISEEKSKIVNLNTNYSEYLGFKLKVHQKGKNKAVKSHIGDKSKATIKNKIINQIKKLKNQTTRENVLNYNAIILGIHNYYKIATHVSIDFNEIAYIINKKIYNRLKGIRSKKGSKSECFNKFYGRYNFKTIYIQERALYPVGGIVTNPPRNFSQDICNYTKDGREKIHTKLQSINIKVLKYLMQNPNPKQSIEYNDNRISLYSAQIGICPISKEFLEIENMECHHKVPKIQGGKDCYSNLILIKTEVHKLIHSTNVETINKYIKMLNIDKTALNKVNKLRILVGNLEI